MCKKLIYLFSALLVLGIVQTSAQANGDPSLMAWWKLDEKSGTIASDSSGNSRNGTLINGPVWVTGRVDGGLSCDGVNDYVNTGYTENLATWTISVLFKSPSAPASAAPSGPVHREQNYQINWNHTSATFRGAAALYAGGAWHAASFGTLEANRWYHLAATYDGETLIAYTDGVLITSNTAPSGTPGTGTYPLTLGRHATSTGNFTAGIIDDVRIYNRALSEAEIKAIGPPPRLKAWEPTPPDGATNQPKQMLKWNTGETAAAHDVYFGTDRTAVTNADTSSPLYIDQVTETPGIQPVSIKPITLNLEQPSTTYYWRIDEIEEDGFTIHKGDIWSFTTSGLKAFSPSPADGSWYVDPNTALAWSYGFTARYHEVYLGTDKTAVTNATTSSTLYYKGRKTSPYSPGTLNKDTMYYWRVDEVESVQTIKHKGDVWSFKTLPVVNIDDPNLIGWWKFDEGKGILTLDWSGHGNLGTLEGNTQWISGYDSNAIEFDGIDSCVRTGKSLLSNLAQFTLAGWVSARNYTTNRVGLFGQNDCVEFGFNNDSRLNVWTASGGGIDAPYNYPHPSWHHVAAVGEGTRLVLYIDGQEVASGGTATSSYGSSGFGVNIGGGGVWDAAGNWFSGWIDDVRIYNRALTQSEVKKLATPSEAWIPRPADGATDVVQRPTLIWEPGESAATVQGHDVYLGDDQTAVTDATTSTPGIYKGRYDANQYSVSADLNLGQIYYWRIDEVNTLNPESPWKGKIWSFTTANYFVLEDYEKYTNTAPNRIQDTWIASGGGTVHYPDPNFAEVTIVHGGAQSMPFDYSNASGATRTFAATDFTKYGVKALSLWTRGYGLPAGSCVQSPPGTYTMTARGADIWDVLDIRHPSTFHDEFHYAYTLVSGDCVIIAKVESVGNTDPWAKAGVMMRDSLDANSIHVMTCITPGSGAAFQYRLLTGRTSTSVSDPNVDAPYWVAIQRVGSAFTGAYCADGASWTQLGSIDIVMADPIYIGLCLTSHNVAATCTAVFSNVTGLPSFTNQDIGIKSNTKVSMFVTLQDSSNGASTIINPDENAVITPSWQVWDIPMSSFAGINKTAITKLAVGLQAGGTGTIYVDDIRLYTPRCMPDILRNPADLTGDCLVDEYDLDILTNSWLVKPPTDISSGLKGYWPFNGNLQDVSGNARHGSDPCGVIAYTAGYAGQAASLNGGYVLVGPVGVSGAAARTVAGWAKASTMNMVTTDWINVFGFTCRSGTLNNRSFDIEKWGNGNAYAIHVYGWEREIMPVDLDWHHLAASYDGTTIRWYGDGQLVGTDSSRVLDTNDLVQMGERGDSPNTNNFQGAIDEVRIYGRVLSLAEVEYLAGTTMIDINKDGSIDFKDYALMADVWLEELLWPQ